MATGSPIFPIHSCQLFVTKSDSTMALNVIISKEYTYRYISIRLLLQKFFASLIHGLQESDQSIARLLNSYWNRWRWKRRFWPCPVVSALCLTLYMRSGQPRWPGWLGPSSPCQIFKYLDMKGEYIWSKIRLKEILKWLQFVAISFFYRTRVRSLGILVTNSLTD